MTSTKTEFMGVLWDSAAESFETMIMSPIEEISEEEFGIGVAPSYTGSITFKGGLKGVILVQCETESAAAITKSMLMMEADEEVDPSEIKDAIGEVANLVLGGFKSRIAEQYGDIDISIPTVIEGQEVRPAIGAGASRCNVYGKADSFTVGISVVCKSTDVYNA